MTHYIGIIEVEVEVEAEHSGDAFDQFMDAANDLEAYLEIDYNYVRVSNNVREYEDD